MARLRGSNREARAAMEESAAVVVCAAVYGVSTGFGSLAARSGRAARGASALPDPLARGRMGPPVELHTRSLAMGHSGARPVVADTMLAPACRRARSGRAGARLTRRERRPCPARQSRPRAARRGRGVHRRRSARSGRRGARVRLDQAAQRSRPRRGWRSSTAPTGSSGCSCSRWRTTWRVCLKVADITAAMSTEALLGTDRAFAGDLVTMRLLSPDRPSARRT